MNQKRAALAAAHPATHIVPSLSIGEIKFYDTETSVRLGGQEGSVRWHVENYPYLAGIRSDDVEYGPWDIGQPFHRKPFASVPDASGLTWNVWEWDGEREAPTLSPSFLVERPAPHHAFRLHAYLRAGRIVLLPDSTIEVA